jgi:hypothetical protein
MKEAIKLKPLTEEQISLVCNYFDTWDKWGLTESQIYILYGRMKYQWVRIDKAEEVIEKLEKRKQDSYRWNKEQEINQHINEYRQQTQWDNGIYELMRLKEWEDGRTIVMWFMWNYDLEKQKQKRSHVVEIEERQNPDYFQEIVKRFNLVID